MRIASSAALFLAIHAGSGAAAQCNPRQLWSLEPSDAAHGDQFGSTAAYAGGLTVVAATYDDDAGETSGSACVFDGSSGLQLFKLTASDGAEWDTFGFSAAIGRGVAAIGTPFDEDFGAETGSVYLFDSSTGAQTLKLLASDTSEFDKFGHALAIGGGMLLVGAPRAGIPGAAYVFDLSTMDQVKTLIPSDGESLQQFGWSVAISGDRAAIGMNSAAFFADPGAVYLFERDHAGLDNWGEVIKLTASDALSGDLFGAVVAIDGDTIVAGACWHDHSGLIVPGAAYVFERDAGGPDKWDEVVKLTASDAADLDRFGTSVAISGDIILVGCPYDDGQWENTGSVYVFMRNHGGPDNWGEVTKITATPARWLDNFGWSLAMQDGVAVVGALFHDGAAGRNSGMAYVFELNCLPCPGDTNGSGAVDVTDLVSVVTSWGPCAGCPADVTGDGAVDVQDLVAVVTAWGPCL